MIDNSKIEQAVRLMLEGIGEDPEREGLRETPARIARMCAELYKGMEEDAQTHLSRTFTVETSDMVIEKDITFYSMCEHHILPFYGKAHIAYIPDGRVVGLSKLARTVEVFAPEAPAPGTAHRADRGCADGIHAAERRSRHAGSGAHVHDHARSATQRSTVRDACTAGRI